MSAVGDNVSSLGEARPFAHSVAKYQKAGWAGTLPLPPKKKNPPPTGFTGHKAPYPTRDQLLNWLNDPKHKRANICLRLAGCDTEYELLGIDVDHYIKGDKDKRGGDQLGKLEDRLGDLPDTWISSARTDGISGIRYYRVPRGLAFRGQVDKDIEAIFKGYRFVVVWPSTNPDHGGAQYWWFPPGVRPDESGRDAWDSEQDAVPQVADLPVLPEAWIEYLSQGKMRSDDDGEIDMESSVDEIFEWASETFNDGDANPPCPRMAKSIVQLCDRITEEATSHDKIKDTHWHLYRLAAEGHVGWKLAVDQVEQCYVDEMFKREKRSRKELRGELFRSNVNALRKIKVQIDRNIAIGAVGVPSGCTCVPVPTSLAGDADGSVDGGEFGDLDYGWMAGGSVGIDGLEYVRYGSPEPPNEYRMNDDGNAEHFIDLFTSPGVGPGIRWVEGYGWIVWSSGSADGTVQPRWVLSTDGLVRRAWQRVRDRQERYCELLEVDFNGQLERQRLESGDNSAAPFGAVKALAIAVRKWKEFALASGNNRNATCALDAAKALPGVTVDINDLDSSHNLMGVANGVLELGVDQVVLRPARADDLITLNTGVNWKDPQEINKLGREKWEEYLELFLPDEDLRRTAQVALGHCLIGGNPEKIFIVLKGSRDTGKSTMANLCAAALGDYAMTASMTIYQNHKLNPVLAKALSRRMVVTTEMSESDKISASMLKRITGGSDVIQAELKGSNVTVERIPQFVPVVATNSVPQIDGADAALRNRLYVIPFNIQVSDHQNDKEAAHILKAVGLEAVLNWLIEGYLIYRRERGLPKDAKVQKESDAFAAELDTVSTFVDQCMKRHPTEYGNHKYMWTGGEGARWIISVNTMFDSYVRWCEAMRVDQRDRLDQNRFGRRLKDLGVPQKPMRVNDKTPKMWFGVRLVGKAASKGSGLIYPDFSSKQSTDE